jgi:hypothetical protein
MLRAATLVAFVVLAQACGSKTEVVVVIDSDLRVPEDIDSVVFKVEGSRVLREVEVLLGSSAEFPLTHGLYPDGRDRFTVSATGRKDAIDVVSDRAASGFVDGERRLLELWLGGDCIGVTCTAPDEVCSRGGCRPIDIPPGMLAPDAGVTMPPDSRCPSDPSKVLCEDFEREGQRWLGPFGAGVTTVSTERPFAGSRGLAIVDRQYIVFDELDFAPGSTLHLRFYAYLSGDDAFGTNLVTASDAGGGGQVVFETRGFISPVVTGFFFGPPELLNETDDSAPIPLERWVCVQLEIAVGTSGRVRALFDRVESLPSSSLQTSEGGSIERIAIGLRDTDPLSAIRGYFDEIAIDDAPIDCL